MDIKKTLSQAKETAEKVKKVYDEKMKAIADIAAEIDAVTTKYADYSEQYQKDMVDKLTAKLDVYIKDAEKWMEEQAAIADEWINKVQEQVQEQIQRAIQKKLAAIMKFL